MTADRLSLPLNRPSVDERPGSSDIAWAERAYDHEQREPANERRTGSHAGWHRVRALVAALVVLFMIGLVLVMRYQGSATAPVTHRGASSQTVTAPPTTIARSPFTPTPPMISPFLPLSPTSNVTRH